MLTAQYLNKRIVAPAADREPVKKLSRDGLLRCPACNRDVVFHAGTRKAWHFKHKAKTSDCPFDDDPDYRPESELHVQLKMALRDWAAAQFPPDQYPGAVVDLEVHVPETGQFADVMLTLPRANVSPVRIALEVQCSPLTGSEWRARVARYAEAGVLDVWLLAGPKHVQQGVKDELVLRDLPGTVLQDRGRVLLTHATAEELKERGQEGICMQLLHGLATHYAGLDQPEEHVEAYREQHVSQQPAYLFNRKPWGARSQPVPTFDIQDGVSFEAPLPQCWLTPQVAVPERVFWVSEEHREADEHARAWERATKRWHAEWVPRREVYNQEQAARRAEARRRAEAEREAAVREVHRLVGEAVAEVLPTLFPALTALAKRGNRTWSEQALRRYDALPNGVKKWPVASWTPLADIPLPLEWVFGVDRRAWQMTVYAYVLSAMYAKSFRREHGIDVKGFDYVATGYALKALGTVGVLQAPPVRHVDRLLARLNKHVTGIASARSDLLPKDWQGQPVVTIDPHRIRHLVIGLYFASLTTHTFLRGPYYGSREPGLQGGGLGGYFDASLHLPGKLLNDVLERVRRWLFILGRKQDKQFETLGAVWLDQARTLSAVETGEFEFVTPLLPPCFDRETAEALREGMQDRTLHVYAREVHVAGKLIYHSQLPQGTRYRSTW